MRRRAAALLLALTALASIARAQDPAALLPDDTFLYVELDAGAFERGLRQLDVVKILSNPGFREFFTPAFRKLQIDPADPAASILERLQVKEWLAGRAAVGVRGLTVAFEKRKRTTFTARKPIGVAVFHELLGALLGELLSDGARAQVGVRLDLDFAAVVEPGPRLSEQIRAFLRAPPFEVRRRAVQMGDRQLLHLSFPPLQLADKVYYEPQVYLHIGEKRVLAASDPKVLASMLAGGPPDSLSRSPHFAPVRERMTGGERVVFGWLDARRTLEIFAKFVPPVLTDLARRHGLASLRGAGVGVSITEGGVRESFGIALDGQPKGIWKLLDAFPGGMRSIEIAPRNTGALIGLKFDFQVFLKRVREVAEELAPGNGEEIEREFAESLSRIGFDLRKEVEPAFGDEIGLLLFKPEGIEPDWVFGVDLRDEQACRAILAKVRGMAEGWAEFKDIELDGGLKAVEVSSGFPGGSGVYAIARGHLFASSQKRLLLDAARKWGREGEKTLAKDSEVFRRALRGATGGEKENLIALSYLDLRSTLPDILGFWPVEMQLEDMLDLDNAPDPTHLFSELSGVAIAVRRDAHGVTVDFFSPVGVVWALPALLYARIAEWR